MDGTGRLFQPFLKVWSAEFRPRVVAYPADVPMDYAAAEEFAWNALPHGEPFALLGESYSGPIALRLAARRPERLLAVVLVASFALAPTSIAGSVASKLRNLASFIPPPAWLIRKFLLGSGAPQALVDEFKQVAASVRPQVLATRLQDILSVDAREELQCCPYPLLCIAASADRLVPQRIYRSMAELRPDMELAVIEGPHCLLQRNPAEVAQRVSEFLRHALAGK
jgi:pimeloyl-ACP methyl ester carboxylesterase